MGHFKNFKTFIRKKIGMVGVAEFVDDPIDANSKSNWNNWFGNKKFLKEYAAPERIKSYQEIISIANTKGVFNNAKSVIDMGCGTGHFLLELNKEFPSIKLFGTDFSKESVHVSKQILPNGEFSVADIYNISPELLKKFDVVICSEVLEHLLYPNDALKNLFDLLSDSGGALLIAVPNGRIDTYSGHINFWSPESWKVFVENNLKDGFSAEVYLFHGNKNNLAIIKKKISR